MTTAEIIAIGSELLGPAKLDTNSLYLTRELQALGIRVVRKTVVGDEPGPLTEAIGDAVRRSPLLLLTGGLGPTADDRTREAVSAALGRRLGRDADMVALLKRYFAARRRTMPEANLRQADRLDGAAWLPNAVGSAPGQWCQHGHGVLVLLPGPARELEAMFEREVRPRLAALAPHQAVHSMVLSVVGLPESEVDARVAPLYSEVANPATTILAVEPGIVELHVVGWGPDAAAAGEGVSRLAMAMELRLGLHVFSRERESLAAAVGRWLRQRHERVAVAESCTGGMVGEWLTGPAGASSYFLGGAECYANAVKQELAGVAAETLQEHGAVSEAVAREMAQGIRLRCQADWGLSVTGIAGPAGGTLEKPVGTVWIGLAGPEGAVEAFHHFCAGDRDRVRRQSALAALEHLRRALLPGAGPAARDA